MSNVNYIVGAELFLPPYYSGEKGKVLVVTKVGRKFANVVLKEFKDTTDEKEMTWKVILETNKLSDSSRRIYNNKEEYENEKLQAKNREEKLTTIQKFNYYNLNNEQLDQIMKIIKPE